MTAIFGTEPLILWTLKQVESKGCPHAAQRSPEKELNWYQNKRRRAGRKSESSNRNQKQEEQKSSQHLFSQGFVKASLNMDGFGAERGDVGPRNRTGRQALFCSSILLLQLTVVFSCQSSILQLCNHLPHQGKVCLFSRVLFFSSWLPPSCYNSCAVSLLDVSVFPSLFLNNNLMLYLCH